jgi:hypothetical protein
MHNNKSRVLFAAILLAMIMFCSTISSNRVFAAPHAPAHAAVAAHATQPLASCYSTARSYGPYTLGANVYLFPSKAPWFVTTSACRDINVNFSSLTAPIQVQVCFIRTNSCNAWKTVDHTNQWYVIASNVLNNTSYRFGLKTTRTTTLKVSVAD